MVTDFGEEMHCQFLEILRILMDSFTMSGAHVSYVFYRTEFRLHIDFHSVVALPRVVHLSLSLTNWAHISCNMWYLIDKIIWNSTTIQPWNRFSHASSSFQLLISVYGDVDCVYSTAVLHIPTICHLGYNLLNDSVINYAVWNYKTLWIACLF